MTISRRAFLQGLAVSAGVSRQLAAQHDGRTDLFRHGVASGDPLADRVILWTRVTPPATRSAIGSIEVTWEIGSDAALRRVVARGTAAAAPERDFTVKVDVTGLEPGRAYAYAFSAGGQRSPVGHTRTLPAAGAERLRLAVASCSNYPAGYFNAYGAIARRADLDAVLHLGDYIYEFAEGVYGDSAAIGRVPMAPGEAATLADYRLRYATYRSDPDLQAAHRRHPFIVVWDDHEIANDAWAGGAPAHVAARQGRWSARRAAAYQAYIEWLPVRETSGDLRLYRRFTVSDLADLVMLDTRGLRDRQPRSAAEQNDPRRSLLGAAQERWLFEELRASARRCAAWRLIGQQILFSTLAPPQVPPLSMDLWAGYPAARQRVIDFLGRQSIADVAILTGDLHSSWALDVPADPWTAARSAPSRSVAIELVTPAISSPPLFADATLRARVLALRPGAPHIRFLDGTNRGYLLLDVTRERLQADWYFVDTVDRPGERESKGATWICERGSGRLTAG